MAAMEAFEKALHEATSRPNDGKKLQNGSMIAADKNGGYMNPDCSTLSVN